MVKIKEDRWHDKYYEVNGTDLGYVNRGSLDFFVDKETGRIYNDATETVVPLKDFVEFVQYLKKNRG